MHWNSTVIIICSIVGLIKAYQEYRRANKQWLLLRVVTVLIAVVAMAAIALPLTYTSHVNKAANEAVLLTKGFNKDSLSNYKTDTAFTFDVDIKNKYPKAKLVTPNQLTQIAPAISNLHVLGYGLTQDEIKQLDSIPVTFYSQQNPKGVIAASWPSKLKQGEQLTVQGKYNNSTDDKVTVILKELNTTVDSVTIEKQGVINFQLINSSKTTGRLIDHLIVLQDKDTIENETVPLIIEPVQPLKVLMLAASPGFENKFLKNWLVEKNFAVAMRSAISKDKLSTEFTNLPQTDLTHLSSAVLGKFDVLIADRLALQTLSPAEQASIKQEITQNGLGLILKADTIFKTGAMFSADFQVYKAVENNPKSLLIQLQGAKAALKALNSGQLFIRDKISVQTLTTDVQNRSLAVVSLAGLGKEVCTTLDDTYSWMLAGDKDDYAAFWSLLIGKAAKTAPQIESWSIVDPYPTINTPSTIQLETSMQPGQMLMNGENASPAQNETLPFQWQSTFWAANAGWHSVSHSTGIAQWLYVYDASNWAAIKALNNTAATKKYALRTKAPDVTKQIHQEVKVLIPKGYFYLLLLLCCTFLWVEDKLSAAKAA